MMSERISAAYPEALEAGVSAGEFWALSPAEVMDCIGAYNRRREEELKKSIRMQFLLASLIPQYLLRNENDPVPHPWDYYPELFKEDKAVYEKAAAEKEFEEYNVPYKVDKQEKGIF